MNPFVTTVICPSISRDSSSLLQWSFTTSPCTLFTSAKPNTVWLLINPLTTINIHHNPSSATIYLSPLSSALRNPPLIISLSISTSYHYSLSLSLCSSVIITHLSPQPTTPPNPPPSHAPPVRFPVIPLDSLWSLQQKMSRNWKCSVHMVVST